MGERKGTNKYYPPDFDPQKHKSLAGYTGQHPLRERARKLKQGILIIRFEMPYNIWCGGCNSHIGMGVRYNAEKSKVGMYYTTPIYKFRMKCHLCDNHFEIKTDPANHDYVIINGARRKEQRWDPAENEQIVPEERASQRKLALDAMYQIEHGVQDKTKLKKAMPALALIEDRQAANKDDYLLNKMARNMFRSEKKSLATTAAAEKSLLEKSSLDISLVPEDEDDIKMAGLMKYNALKSFDDHQTERKEAITNSSIFGSTSSPVIQKSPTSSTKARLAAKAHQQKLVKAGGFGVPAVAGTSSGLSQLRQSIVRPNRTAKIDPSTSSVGTIDVETSSTASEASINNKSCSDSSNNPSSDTDETTAKANALNSLLSHYDSSESNDSS